jgi:hypothetical protein
MEVIIGFVRGLNYRHRINELASVHTSNLYKRAHMKPVVCSLQIKPRMNHIWGIIMNQSVRNLGYVEQGRFIILVPESASGETMRLTEISMEAAQSPESAEIDLTDYEGDALAVKGQASGEWIYDAEIIDHTGPILTFIVKKLFTEVRKSSIAAALH